jgi:hypothetical protein
MTVKTNLKDARRLAQLIRMGWFRPVYAKLMGARLAARKHFADGQCRKAT